MGYLINYKAIRSLVSQFDAEKLGFLILKSPYRCKSALLVKYFVDCSFILGNNNIVNKDNLDNLDNLDKFVI